ncbi:hypothetical protein [Microbacterium sp. ABRD28]|uniref:hypothetical protein n=1 Tax=Microbacterium sp. ABRD28 TaxID=2268461 RepID=UPI000F557393|nr:hypothetical protein [Microbacterium sp. ABRD28]
MKWELRLPAAESLAVVLPLGFGFLAALTAVLPARVAPGAVLAPAALLLWVIWVLWAYPSMSYRNGEFVIRNPLRSVSFTASSQISVSGSGVPRVRYGSRSVRPVVMLISPGGVVNTMQAGQGVVRGVNVVRMETLAPGFAADSDRAATRLSSICARAGNVPVNYIERWNAPGIAFTLTLIAWAVSSTLL